MAKEIRDQLLELIGSVSDFCDLENTKHACDERMKEVAAKILKPGSDKTIGGDSLVVLDYIWDVSGDRIFGPNLLNHLRAIDYYVGRKIHHFAWGTGVLVKMKKDYGIEVNLKCAQRGCKSTTKAYARPGVHSGAFCLIYDENSKLLADLRDQEFRCGCTR